MADVAANVHLTSAASLLTSSSRPADACGALARSFAPPPRRCAFDVQPHSLGSTSPRSGETVSQTSSTPSPWCWDTAPPAPRGIRILDLSRAWAGPYGTRYLADFGAEVIKVESGKYPDGRQPGDPGYEEINRNKRPITLNFQIPKVGNCSNAWSRSAMWWWKILARVSWCNTSWTTASARGASRSHHGQYAGLWDRVVHTVPSSATAGH